MNQTFSNWLIPFSLWNSVALDEEEEENLRGVKLLVESDENLLSSRSPFGANAIFVVLDLETTGFLHKSTRIIQIAGKVLFSEKLDEKLDEVRARIYWGS